MSTQPPENPWPAGGAPPPPGYWQPPPGSPPPWRPPPAIDKSRIRPRTFWYFVAAALFAACIIGSGLVGFNAVKHFFGPFDRFTAPGSVVVALEKGEGRSIYQQGSSNFSAGDFRCSARGEGTFSRPALTATTGSFEFSRGDGRT